MPDSSFSCETNGIKMSFRYIIVVSLLSFLPDLQVTGCNYTCQEQPIFTPSKVVVKYGDPVNATCTMCRSCSSHTLDLEHNVGKKARNGTEISWIVDKITEWRPSPTCYYSTINGVQCCKDLDVIVYKPPHNVSIGFVNHTGPIKKNGLHTLRCDVLDVAPVNNLIVTFYKGQTALVQLKSTDNKPEPTNADFTLKFNFTKADNGAEFWCEAKLEMGPEGPQPPPVVKSGKLTATVHYGPELEGSSEVKNIYIKRGETLHLNCSADGNPPPSYTWMIPLDTLPHNGRVFTVESVDFWHGGEYICNISNSVGFTVVKFNVTVTFKDIIFIILGVIVGLVLICSVVLIVYKSYKRNRMGHYSLMDVFHLKKRHTQIPVK
ncbi:intercellular adhesion molecule 1-like isoform X2 [Melanotaenia boesemani]|uniref:intercellular adhesion molecule 1-like isoform X2 n=1 Tax=Melanotaenia boesemani TaxID=1250792 RepID=UPI001C054FC7|nr:intercellular adhesion molecule 1-like isoform X2 [Melanotaenia boesemani]